jgi:hypothetical protein
MLKVWSDNKIIDTRRLTGQTPHGSDAVKTSGSVKVVARSSSGETLRARQDRRTRLSNYRARVVELCALPNFQPIRAKVTPGRG